MTGSGIVVRRPTELAASRLAAIPIEVAPRRDPDRRGTPAAAMTVAAMLRHASRLVRRGAAGFDTWPVVVKVSIFAVVVAVASAVVVVWLSMAIG